VMPDSSDPVEMPPQLVVLAEDGLNLRNGPSNASELVAVLPHGSLVDETGNRHDDTAGNIWVPVLAQGGDGQQHEGWVSADFVEPHPTGAQNEKGRFNPQWEKLGYRWVEAKDGDTIRLIAVNNSADVVETVMLNMDHITAPDVIFPGDRIYLPDMIATV
jgi:Bacterial SH3 domain